MLHSKNHNLRIALNKFDQNARISNIQARFFKRLFNTRAGLYVLSFQKWKTVPEPKDSEMYKLGNAFEKKLAKLIDNRLKSTFDPMKDINYDALSAKRWCIRVLIEKSMSGQKRAFLHWHNLAKQ